MKTYCYQKYEDFICGNGLHPDGGKQFQCRKCAYTDSVIAKRADELEAYEEQKKRVAWEACLAKAYAEDKARDEVSAYREDNIRNIRASFTWGLGQTISFNCVDQTIIDNADSATKAKAIARVKEIKEGKHSDRITSTHFEGDLHCNPYECGAVVELMHLFGITEEDLK